MSMKFYNTTEKNRKKKLSTADQNARGILYEITEYFQQMAWTTTT